MATITPVFQNFTRILKESKIFDISPWDEPWPNPSYQKICLNPPYKIPKFCPDISTTVMTKLKLIY
jgi:hypothetical protein